MKADAGISGAPGILKASIMPFCEMPRLARGSARFFWYTGFLPWRHPGAQWACSSR
jgi:hypothetical protein